MLFLAQWFNLYLKSHVYQFVLNRKSNEQYKQNGNVFVGGLILSHAWQI